MENEFIPYEQALTLKELGFDEPCRDHWERGVDGYGWGLFSSGDWLTYKDLTPEYKDNDGNICGEFSCPTFSQAFRWFREKYKIFPYTYTGNGYLFHYCMFIKDRDNQYHSNDLYLSNEEAELECLKKLIEIVKNK